MATLWPVTLPQRWETSSFSEEAMSNTVVSEPEAGAVMIRKRFTAVPRKVSGTMILDGAQYDIMEAFFLVYTGVLFQWLNSRGSTRYYLFSAAPKYSMLSGLYYRVSLEFWEFLSETGGG